MKIFNRRAKFKYQILEKVEAGVVLLGAEVKSIRAGRADLSEAFARIRDGEGYLVNAYINPWMGSEKYKDTRRERKLLLHKSQVRELSRAVLEQGLTLVPLRLYLKDGLAKVELALVRGRKHYDKRAAIAQREAQREMARALRRRQ